MDVIRTEVVVATTTRTEVVVVTATRTEVVVAMATRTEVVAATATRTVVAMVDTMMIDPDLVNVTMETAAVAVAVVVVVVVEEVAAHLNMLSTHMINTLLTLY